MFRGVSGDTVKRVVSGEGIIINDYTASRVICGQEGGDGCFGIILAGEATVSGREAVLRRLGRGDVFGAAFMFCPDRSFVTEIRAHGKCRAAIFNRALIEDIVTSDARAALNYIEFLSGRVQFLNRRIDSFSQSSVERKLAGFLLELPRSEDETSPPLIMRTVAEMLAVGRASLYRILDIFESEGYIKRDGKRVIIKNKKALEDIKDGKGK